MNNLKYYITFLAEKYVEILILLYRYKLGDSLLFFFLIMIIHFYLH